MKKTLRTFVAVEISEPIRARATELIAALDGTAAEVKSLSNNKLPYSTLCRRRLLSPIWAWIRGQSATGVASYKCGISVTYCFTMPKWVEPHNLHLTLKFLGEVHQREISRVCRAVELGADEVAPFPLDVRGAGAFPNVARPRTVWIGAGEGDEQMVRLHDRVEAALAELGYREERRRFQVHLTIGRVRGGGGKRGQSPFAGTARRVLRTNGDCPLFPDLLQKHADFSAGKMTVERVTIFASRLTPDGPIHEVLGSARLGRS